MEIAMRTLSLGFNPQILRQQQKVDGFVQNQLVRTACSSLHQRTSYRCFAPVYAISSAVSTIGEEDVGVSSLQFEEFSVVTATIVAGELKIDVVVNGAKTRDIFEEEFSKMVANAQPIPGFRRVKGGKTPNIPKDILLEVLGPCKVYKQVIKKVINKTVAQYVKKESLMVSKDLRVVQSFEELEGIFEPGEQFSFGAILKLQEAQ
ncbi:hypothetical protein Ancab_010586 [Ancistrocladus abbreviatus]